MIRVRRVQSDSIAAACGIAAGATLLRINGRELRDSLDLRFYEADAILDVEAQEPDGTPVVYEIEKDPDESLGIVPEADKVRRCTNACPFCFVKGNPRADKLRPGLYVKDDDYRLSFQFGHYVTLTNLREEDWERIVEQRLSPLYVSVHATDPDVRRAMLVNPRSSRIREDLDRLSRGRIQVHAQVVLCPELNDGQVLQQTIDELWGRGDDVLSLSIVPVGLTEHNLGRGVRPLTAAEAGDALDRVDSARERARAERGRGWCYAADELFLQAGRELPGTEYFDEGELLANGVGAISSLRERVVADLPGLPSLRGRRLVLVTGTSMAPHLRDLGARIAEISGAEIRIVPVVNGLYGPLVTTAGLLGGRDHLRALEPVRDWDAALITRTVLNDEGLFLDDMTLEELRHELPEMQIWPSEHVTDVLLDL